MLACAALLLTASAAPTASAQAAVTLDVDVTEAYVNEPFVVTIRVENFEACDPPVFPQMPTCTVRQREGGMDSQYTSIINGRMTVSRTRSYQYELTPRKAGQLVIAPVQVTVDGRKLQTEAVRLAVRASDAAALFGVEISCDRERVYVGQRVRVVMTIWVKPARVDGRSLGQRDMMAQINAIEFGPFPRDKVNTDSRVVEDADGKKQTQYTYQTWTDIVPDRPGRLAFDEVEVGMQYPVQFSRDIFGRVQVARVRNLRARPEVTDIEVMPLPTNGRPANFTGAVGTYDINVIAEPSAVRVGDPIQLAVEIRGDGPLESLPPPDLAADPRLSATFRVPREELAGQVIGSRKRFTQVIRAENADVEEIPSIEYPYFDPDRGLYAVALSAPVPIRVSPAPELDANALAEIAGTPSTPDRPDLRVLDGLRGNETREVELLRGSAAVSPTALAWATFTPPACFVLAWIVAVYAHTGGPIRQRRQRALRQARRRLDQARRSPPREAAAGVAAALAGYLAERLDEPSARFTGRAAVDFLREREVKAQTQEAWRDVLETCERASFGGLTDSDSAALVERAHGCVKTLERERL